MIVSVNYEKNKNIMAMSLTNDVLLKKNKPVFLCVGSDKVLGDLVGVLTGELLKNKYKIDAHVYGCFDHPVNATNLSTTIKHLRLTHPYSPIVLVDAILGEPDEIGQVKFYGHPSYAGGEFHEGVLVGDYSILGVVSTKGIDSLGFLRAVKIKTVVSMAEFIAESIDRAFKFSQHLI